jgi:hypothetical protein
LLTRMLDGESNRELTAAVDAFLGEFGDVAGEA